MMVSGAILALVGASSPCSPTPVGPALDRTPTCGDVLVITTVGLFALVAGALVLFVSLRTRPSARTMRQVGLSIGVPTVALLAAFALLAVVPAHQSFTLHDVAVSDLESTCSGIDTTQGTSVTFHWWAATSISFGAWSCSADHIVYQGSGTNGSGTFTSLGGVYEFGTSYPPVGPPACEGANVTGTYTGPLLAL